MDREFLERCLADGLSLPQIGALVDRNPSTVGYWVEKYGLVANGRDKYAPRGGLTREQLEPLVAQHLTLKEIAERLDVSVSTVQHWLKRHGIQRSAQSRRRARAIEALRAGLTRFEATCRRHGVTDFVVYKDGRSRCMRCNAAGVAERRRRVKRILIEEAGGKCQLCGYDRHPAALQFHHVDPATKRFVVSRRGITRSIEEVRREARKCVLLCANCHAEVEAGVSTVPVEFLRAA